MKVNFSDESFAKSLIYDGWAYCFNSDCPMASKCFRFQSSRFKPESKICGNAVYPGVFTDQGCKCFVTPQVVNVTWGFRRLYDDVKTRHADSIKMRVMGLLGGKTNYYRYNRGEKKLLPEQQQLIAAVFREYGYNLVNYEHTAEQAVLVHKLI